MSGVARSGLTRGMAVLAVVLLCAACMAGAYAAPVSVDVPAFATQQASTEGTIANFWGPAIEAARTEAYANAPNGMRRVQYFQKARMEESPIGVTNGLLTVELISGQRQTGDTRFAAFPPCALPVVGDPDNAWPTYESLGTKFFPERADQSGSAIDTVYKPDGTFDHDAQLGAKSGAAAGSYVSDPGGRYAHNIPAAFTQYLATLPAPWQSAMGFPLTEAFWVNVHVKSVKTWVLVQPFERRVLSYTPDNAAGFTVEMGNIGQHYYRWRYSTAPDPGDSATGTATDSGTDTGTMTANTAPVISGVRFGLASSTTASLSFQTDVPATSRILFGTASHSYQTSHEINVAPVQDHRITLSGLMPKTKYFFVLRAATDSGSSESKEGYFATAAADATAAAATQDANGNPAPDTQPTATIRINKTAKLATATDTTSPTDTPHPTTTPRPDDTPTVTNTPTATSTPRLPTPTATMTSTPTPHPPTNTSVPTNTPTPAPTAVPDVHVSIAQFAVGSDGSDLTIIQTSAATLTVTLADTTSADTRQTTIMPRTWVPDTANVRLVATDAPTTLAMHGHQSAMTVRLDVSVPIRDHGILAYSVTQTVYPGDYGAGRSYTIAKGSSSTPGYHADIQFTVSQG